MKPRNKYEEWVARVNATLSEDIAVEDIEWFKETSKDWDFGRGRYLYFTLITTVNEFRVSRLYRGYKFTDKNTSHFFFVEIMREFDDEDKGMLSYCAKNRQMGGYYDTFTTSSDITLKRIYANYGGYRLSDLFHLSCASKQESYGERVPCMKSNPRDIARAICNNPVAETLYKNNDPLFGWIMYRTHLKDICKAITIAKRHGFVFTRDNTSLWLDMVQAMIYCKKDWHNPIYVAPEDLHATHDRFMKMYNRKRIEEDRRRAQERVDRQLMEEQKRLAEEKRRTNIYIKNRKRFFDMVLEKGTLSITVLPDIEAFKDNAEYFHNCVYRMGYWDMLKHPDSLIMVACVGGNRTELIEVSLTDYSIRQCFGKHNQFSNYHNRIVNFVKNSMDTIKAYNENNVRTIKAA